MARAQVWLAAALCAAWSVPSATLADPVTEFYAGKTVHVLIGYSVGGGYDLYARMLARHMGKHIPGNPTLLPENMPGAGSLKVVNFLYSAAPKDGATFGTFGRGVIMEPLLQRSHGAKFEATKFTWIGSVTDEVSVCAFHARTGIKTFADLKASKKTLAVGGTGPGSNTDVYATLVKNALGAPLRLVTGYPGGSELNLAILQGELDGRCGWSWSSLRTQERALYDSKQINLVAQIGLKRHPEIGDVPLVTELADSERDKAMIRLIVSREAMARPFAAPPGIPAERAKALREAFDATMKDPEFLAEAERLKVEVRPMTGVEVEDLVKDIYAAPPDVLSRAVEAMKPSK